MGFIHDISLKINEEFKYITDDNKYTFIKYKNDYSIHILRYNEAWLKIEAGSKALCTLMYEYLNKV